MTLKIYLTIKIVNSFHSQPIKKNKPNDNSEQFPYSF